MTSEQFHQQLAAMEQKFASENQKRDALIAKALADIERIKRAHVTGLGHSGTIDLGMQFDPSAVNDPAHGGEWVTVTDCDGDTMDIFARNVTPAS